jgi:hypothetical protein
MTASAAPLSKFNDLLSQAMDLFRDWPSNAGVFAIKRIERDAASLRENAADLAGSWEIEGICAAARKDIEKALECVRKAAFAPGADEQSTLRIASALAMVGATDDATSVANAAVERWSENMGVKRIAAAIQANAGDFVSASRIDPNYLVVCSSKDLDRVLNEAGWTQPDVEMPARFVRDFLREHEALVLGANTRIGGYESGSSDRVVHSFEIVAAAEKVNDLEDALFESLAERNFPAEVTGFLVFTLEAIEGQIEIRNGY